MKVGDLVIHPCWPAEKKKAPAIVLAFTRFGHMFKIFHPDDGCNWEINKYYEVLNEGR